MEVEGLAFDWDDGNLDKCQKHGLSVQDIEGLFLKTISVFPDPKHSNEEERFIGLGKTEEGRSVLVVSENSGRRCPDTTDQRPPHAQERDRLL